MTGQIPDTINFNGHDYSVGGLRVLDPRISGRDDGSVHGAWKMLFDPSRHGMKVEHPNTACWRGYVSHFSFINDQLYLSSLELSTPDPPKMLLGHAPMSVKVVTRWDVKYRNIQHPIGFTGELLVGDDFIRDLYVHMGFQPAWKYKKVLHFVIDQGHLVQYQDRSTEAADFRDSFGHRAKGSIPYHYSLSFYPWPVSTAAQWK